MKTYNEMASDALRRIGEHEENQRKRRLIIKRTVTPILSFGLAAFLGIGIWRSGTVQDTPTPQYAMSNDTIKAESTEKSDGRETQESVKNQDTIVINHIDGISSDSARMNINLQWDDFVKMDAAELIDYYGTDIFPSVPSDLTNWDTADDFGGYGIYRRNKGTGEVYWDTTVLNYANSDITRSVNIEVAKDRLPFVCFAVDTAKYQKSVISEHEVYIGISEAGYYQAQFMHHNTGFILTMEGLSEKEVISVIQSIIK